MAQLHITQNPGFYAIDGVMLSNGNFGTLQLTTFLLNNGQRNPQEQWIRIKKQTGWGPGSGPLVNALLLSLYDNKGTNGVEELRDLFAKDFWRLLVTSTSITYKPNGLALITHDIGMPEEETIEARLVGPKGHLDNEMEEATQALLGSKDTDKIQAVYKWVTGRNVYMYRLTKAPKQNRKTVLMLGHDVYIDFRISANCRLDESYARGIRLA